MQSLETVALSEGRKRPCWRGGAPSDFATVSMSRSPHQQSSAADVFVGPSQMGLAVICRCAAGHVPGAGFPLAALRMLGGYLLLAVRPALMRLLAETSLVFLRIISFGSVGRTGRQWQRHGIPCATNCKQGQQHPHIVFWRLIINVWREFPANSTERIYHPGLKCCMLRFFTLTAAVEATGALDAIAMLTAARQPRHIMAQPSASKMRLQVAVEIVMDMTSKALPTKSETNNGRKTAQRLEQALT